MQRQRLADLSEEAILARILPFLHAGPEVLVAPGDDAAVVMTGSRTVVTTDSMVRGRDWRDDWSSGSDVGHKVVAQNIADVAAMGARCTGLVVAVAADPMTQMAWLEDLALGIGDAAAEASVSVVGGDLSSAPHGALLVTVTAFGDLQGREPVLRSGARVGDVVAVCGTLGWSGGGLWLYAEGVLPPALTADSSALDRARSVLQWTHRTAARPPYESGPLAADSGATSLIDVSDGLVRDAGRVAVASGVEITLDGAALRAEVRSGPLGIALGSVEGLRQVLSGGEEHCLLATFPPARVPQDDRTPWRVIGRVVPAGAAGPRVTLDGAVPEVTGWDHFAG